MKLREKIAMAALLSSLTVLSAEAQDVQVGKKDKPKGFGRRVEVKRDMSENGTSIVTLNGRQNQSARLVMAPSNENPKDSLAILSGSVFVPEPMKKDAHTQSVKIVEVVQAENSDILSGKIIEREFDRNGNFIKDKKNQAVLANVALQEIRTVVYGPVIE